MSRQNEIRAMFPSLDKEVYGKKLVYFDNAATSQRPSSVIELWNRLTVNSTANIHRAVHKLAADATDAYEDARDAVKNYINAAFREEVVFSSGTTASINLVASSFSEAFIGDGDEVIVSEAEHHSNIVSWQLACKRKNARIKVIPVADNGRLMVESLEDLITPRTRIVAVSHISNVLGIVNPVEEVIRIAHSHDVPVLVDGAQGIVHRKVDVQTMDCDFYAFSGHKIYAATGTGVLYGKKKWLEAMPPFMGGGEMVGNVSFEETTYAPLPMKFEAGTQHFTGQATFKPALETAALINAIEDGELSEMMSWELGRVEGIRIFGTPDAGEKIPLFSFCIDGVHHEDLALILDKMGIAVRSGQMCAEPLMKRFGVTGMLRASLAPYNTEEEIKYFIESLKRAVSMLR
ncbi:MAG: SufS family cysteine desulfurase [Bacteroidales bacterium]|nr:SufS family cysteine desulfurase [Bacteroidales bacterium]